jgi:hypothetical protein
LLVAGCPFVCWSVDDRESVPELYRRIIYHETCRFIIRWYEGRYMSPDGGNGNGPDERRSRSVDTGRRNVLLTVTAGVTALAGCTDSVTVSFGGTETDATPTATTTADTATDSATPTAESTTTETTDTATTTEAEANTDTDTDTETDTDTATDTETKTDSPESESDPEGGTDVSASIVSFDPKGGTFSLGETQTAEVTVENTGDTEHTFYVGYSVRDPSGDGRFNGAGPPELTLSPGEIGEVTTDYTVTEEAPNGSYGAFTTVRESWDGEDFGETLDDSERSDVFEVQRDAYESADRGGVSDTGLAVVDHYWDTYDRRVYCTVENVSSSSLERGRVRCTVRYGDDEVSQFESAIGTTYPSERYEVYFGIGRQYADNYVLSLKSSASDEWAQAIERTAIPR